ncbi:MAG: AraC family transcriptional regulator [Methylacidiphilales bacterium]|nr:AraC family transcriptional regulator [Candidatus Methylacidiphilales bacterium]
MIPTSPLSERIETLASRISDPVSYLHGRIAPPAVFPNSILCFVRRRADKLNLRPAPSRTQHHRYLFIAALRGAGRICVDAATHTLREGQARLVFPFQYHSYLAVRPANICWVFLTFEMDTDPRLEHLRIAPSRLLGETELFLLAEILRLWTTIKSPALLQLHLATLLGRFGARKSGPEQQKKIDGLHDDSLLARVNRHVLARPGRRLVLKQLAAAVGQSESHLRRRFRAATGLSLGRHLRELRLQQACSLLHRTPQPVGEIARACGFDSIYSFSRAFTRSLSVSPRAYRRNFRPG